MSDKACDPPQQQSLRLPADRRLKDRKSFLRVYRQGRKAHGRFVTVFCLRRPDGVPGQPPPGWRLGITATRKVGGAVVRNRHRRLVREYFRLNQRRIPAGWDFVVNTKHGLERLKPPALAVDLGRVLTQLGVGSSAPNAS